MEKAKAPDLYAVLGLVSQHASQADIRDAYWKLASRFQKDERFRKNRQAILKVKSAFNTLGDPKKRSEYDHARARARAHQEMKGTPERTCNPHGRSPLGEGPLAFRDQFPLQAWILQTSKRAGRRRAPARAQLRVQAQLRAHAHFLARAQQEEVELRKEHIQALREEIREGGIGPDDEFEKVWALVYEMFELDTVSSVEDQKALVREALEEEMKSQAEKAAREQEAAAEAAAQARTKETEWINNEAAGSILVLAGMGARSTTPLATGHAQMLQEDYVKRLIEKTNDLLDYLWDKAHSGGWLCPEIKDAVDLDWLMGLVLQRDAQASYFPSATQQLAASLLRKWCGEDYDATDGGTSLFSDSESSDSEGSEGGSSSDESDSEEEAPSADLQNCIQAAKPQHSLFARNAAQPSPFAQGVQQSSPFAQNAQQKSPFSLGNQQHNTGAGVSLAGYKRVQSSGSYEEQENQRLKRQKHISHV